MAASSDDNDGEISGINVTPLVDIMLVLLVIFMVTARFIEEKGVPMELPKAATADTIQTIFHVELTVDGKTYVNEAVIASDTELVQQAKKAKSEHEDLRVVIRSDVKVEYGRVLHVMDLLRQNGVSKIGFASEKGSSPMTIDAAGTKAP